MGDEDGMPQPASVRNALLFKTMLEVLRDAGAPRRASDVVAEVRRRTPFTDYEMSRTLTGKVRGDNAIRFSSSWARIAGWMTKATEGWQLTEAGLAALDRHRSPEELSRAMGVDYDKGMAERRGVQVRAEADAKYTRLEAALDLIEAGAWTTYGDLAEVTGLAAQGVGNFMTTTDSPNAFRVLSANGTVASGFTWADPTRHDDPLELLRDEGVEFDEEGRASQAQRLTAYEIAQLLDGEDAELPRRAWLVRGNNVNGKNLVPVWLERGSCSVAASQIRSLVLPLSRAEIVAVVEEDYAQKSYNTRNEKVTELDLFLNRIQVGDLVVTNDGSIFYFGTVTGEPVSVQSSDERSNLRRAVSWANATDPVDLNDLPSGVKPKLSSQHPIVDLTSELAALRALVQRDEASVATAEKVAAPELMLPPATEALGRDLLVSKSWLQECIDLLADRRQVIFYGPPGTGKTYLAQAIAAHLTDSAAIKLVQFHPAYSYEDFFEGYRPAPTKDGSGTIGFTLTPGPFRKLVDTARENPGTPYILIIDEINRANLAKVFGELYFLLEYRDRSIDLLYSSGDEAGFTMPPNVFIIGTMNTADRSIALVDAAMRRRFAFKALHPSVEPTRSMLAKWLDRRGLPAKAALVMDHLNGLIQDEDFKIGPSYFMRDSVNVGDGMAVTWETAILPLLEEHHFGEGMDVAKEYSLTRILSRINAAAEAAPVAVSEIHDAGTVAGEPEPDQG
jgi:5-methylcytosine-specific restriction protein B